MPINTNAAYWTDDRRKIIAWERHNEAVEDMKIKLVDLAKEFGCDDAYCTWGFGGSVTPLGFVIVRDAKVPVGLRVDTKARGIQAYWAPDRRIVEGREISRKLKDLGVSALKLEGMPGTMHSTRNDNSGAGWWLDRHLELHGRRLWATFSMVPDDKDDQLVHLPWRRVPLSEYHAMLENESESLKAHAEVR